MSAKMMKANPNAEVNLLDLSPDMAVYAHENKVPNDHVHISDITQMKYGWGKTRLGRTGSLRLRKSCFIS